MRYSHRSESLIKKKKKKKKENLQIGWIALVIMYGFDSLKRTKS